MDCCIKVVPIILLALVARSSQQDSSGSFKRVCYYTNWAQYNRGPGIYKPENIDPLLCTHIVYAFADLNANHELVAYEWNDDSEPWLTGMWELVNNHKETNPNLRTLLALGGWNFGTQKFTSMVSTVGNRAHFISTTIAFLREKNFDGFDSDWEYPGSRGSPPSDKEKFVMLLREFREAIEDEDVPEGKDKLLLTAAVGAGKTTIDAGYNIPEISRELDWVGLMSYDLHGDWDPVTGHNSALDAADSETGLDAGTFNVKWAVNYWLSGGCPRNKLLVGMATYGRSFKLTNPSNHGVGAPASGAGTQGEHTKAAGFLAYYEICVKLQNGATRVWDEERSVPYYYHGDQWVGYDDRESFRVKLQWIKEERLAGTMVWPLDLDDFTGEFCNQGRYPLLSVIQSELGDAEAVTVTDAPPQTQTSADSNPVTVRESTTALKASTTTAKATTEPVVEATTAQANDPTTKKAPEQPTGEVDCMTTHDGLYPHPDDCNKFIQCSWGRKFVMNCGPGTVFNPAGYCDWPYNVPGCY